MVASALLHAAISAHLNDTIETAVAFGLSLQGLPQCIYLVTVSSRVTAGKQETLCAQIHGPTEPVSLTVSLDVNSGKTVILEEAVNQDFYRCLFFQYNVIELQDPSFNRIAQWLDKSTGSGILDFSHTIIPEAAQGLYRITATTEKGEQISHSFDIKEYVLPKYEVKVHLPRVITILDKEATVKICGKYTYGKPVAGSLKAVFCRKLLRFYWYATPQDTDICKTYKLTTDKSGCATQIVNLAEFFHIKGMYHDSLEVNAEIEEFGTGVILQGSGKVSFTSTIRTVTFEDTPETYKPGIPFEGKVKVTGPNSEAVANEAVYLFADNSQDVVLTTDTKGMASFSLDTSLWKDHLTLKASFCSCGYLFSIPVNFSGASSKNTTVDELYVPNIRRPEYRSAYFQVSAFYSKSSSFLKLMHVSEMISCDKDATVRARYIIQGKELKEGQEVLDFSYLVMSRGRIVQHGQLPVAVKADTVNKGELSIPLHQVTDLAPFAQVVIYTVMPTGEAVADSQDFPIQRCLNNKVFLKFSSLQKLPAEKTSLSLQAHPGSLCSVRAIDQSILLLKPEQEVTVDYVYNQLPLQKLSGYTSDVEDFEPYPCRPVRETEAVLAEEATEEPEQIANVTSAGRAARSLYFVPPEQKNDVYSIFKDIGIKIVTNSDVKKPYNCEHFMFHPLTGFDELDSPVPMAFNMMPQSSGVLKGKEDEKKETIRTFFPETWIWDLVTVGDSGSVVVEKTVPDTITKWAAGAFCVSSLGFGVSPNTGLTAFQPFFVSLTLPYSVIRGEVFTLKATVFNYLSKCIMNFDVCQIMAQSASVLTLNTVLNSVISSSHSSGEVNLKVSAEALKTDMLCGNEVATVPDTGRIDTVIRTLLVQAEGTPQMVSHNALLCPAEGPVQKNISLLMPEMFVAGSARASVSVLGDLMGRAMKNLGKLLAMPYGCGEQNMVLFAPNIFILNYLKSTGQLTQEIQDRATRFLESGYQRELTYKHDDGSYSAFGKSDASGNTWLTSFVMKSFGGARPYIFVHPSHIMDARRWLSGLQQPDGCIKSVGKLFHNGMKGGVSDDVSLTAYITTALLELDTNITDPMVQKCLSCLKEAVAGQLDNLYTTALLSYTFTLAGDEEMRNKLITYLHLKSNTQGGNRHWNRAGAPEKTLDSLEVEMTSYVLLALLSGPPLQDFGLDYSSAIVRWLTQQQNPYGGFSSTQDTVVALQALAKYGAATYSEEGSTTVTVTSLGGLSKVFTVDQSNRLLYQEERLPEVPGEYTIKAQGPSCVLAQISMHYNIPPPPDFSAFAISSITMAKCNVSRPQLILFVHIRYQGRREETNMVIINIKLLSGYILDKSSLNLLKSDESVKRVDVEEGFINIYLDGLKKEETKIYSVTLEEDVPVRNLKPAVVKVYDYYQTSDEAVTDYTSTCAESDSINKL
ncbi:Alpha-2-macroglobulin [Channa argus]|uniref:Alpha-2-macroglobulin n=1 Tax=Channa argus TaxID=215402 RepID=A0A6G1PQL3_CHAAH|nr:Alpha-2-macroglobulin [Channa argus]